MNRPVTTVDRAGGAVGIPIVRPDAEAKVRGEARYADDLAFAGMVHVKAIRSERPHARIRAVDLAEVAASPGVVGTVTAADVPGENIVPVIYRDMPLLAAGVVRYVGEPIALVAAETREAAEEAAPRARVGYDDLPAVFDPQQALAPDAPQVAVPYAAEGGNVFNHMVIRKGDVGKGFADADVIVEGEYEVGYQEHAYLEPQGVIAVPEDGGMTVYGTLQCPFYVQNAVANVLGLPLAKVRIVQTATGGGFGGKEDVPSHLAAMAAVAAWKLRRPAKLVLDRAEDIATTSKRHPGLIRYRTGATRDGTLTAVEVKFYYNAGAYQTLSSAVLWRGLVHAAGPYRIPHVTVDAYSVATNTVPCGAFRGFGSPQVIFAHESQMDELARKLGIDPLVLRERNALREGDRTSTDQVLSESVGLGACIEKARELSQWGKRQAEVAAFNARERFKRRGLGVSTVMYGVGMGAKAPLLDKAGAYLKLEADGSVTLAVGTTEMGQGAETVLSQIAADGLGVPLDAVRLAPVDTSRVPDSGPTVASRTTTVQGMAVLDAATKLRARIEDAVREMFRCPSFTLEGRLFCIPGDPPREVDIAEVARWMWAHNWDMGATGWAEGRPVDWDPATGLGNAYFVYAYACHVALVEVDLLTGEAHVAGFWAVHDSGKIVNPATARGQVIGGIAQGIGYVLMEELRSRDGRILAPSFTAYHIPTSLDVPPEVAVEFVEAPYSGGPFGAKGLGEVPLMASHAAVANAISAAAGSRLRVYPAIPERVLGLIESSI
ncbi:xanthine dehydrogenase family protein [Candidatus Bipolaricaulota bacterium]|nr:xanthine dehydrogenase family protein [Candidatus Bipolaricaulota bacterium]